MNNGSFLYDPRTPAPSIPQLVGHASPFIRRHRRRSVAVQTLPRGMASITPGQQRGRRALVGTMIVQLPAPHELAPWIEKLEAHPGSVVLIAVEQPEICNLARCTAAWLSREERTELRRALEVCRKQREKSHDAGRGDLGSVSASKDSESLETNAPAKISSPIRAIGGGGKESIRTCHSGSVGRSRKEEV